MAEEESEALIQICNRSFRADFSTVPPALIYRYKNECYDLEEIITHFNKNWFQPDFVFRIEKDSVLSFKMV